MFASGPILWVVVIALGALILGGVIAYAMRRSSTTTRLEDAAAEQKTRDLYHKDESRPH